MFLKPKKLVNLLLFFILEWGEWKNNGSCSVTCGEEGLRTVSRDCLDYIGRLTDNIRNCFSLDGDDNEGLKMVPCNFNFSCTGMLAFVGS